MHVVQVRLAAASEQLSRLFEHTYVFQCYQPTYSSGHYAFMFASRTRHGRAEAARPRGHPPMRPPTVSQAITPSHRAAPLWAREQYPSPQRPRHRGCGGAPLPARSRQCRRVWPCRLHPSKDHAYYGRLHPFKAKVDWARYTLPTTYT